VSISKGEKVHLHAAHTCTNILYNLKKTRSLTHELTHSPLSTGDLHLTFPPERVAIYGDSIYRQSLFEATRKAVGSKFYVYLIYKLFLWKLHKVVVIFWLVNPNKEHYSNPLSEIYSYLSYIFLQHSGAHFNVSSPIFSYRGNRIHNVSSLMIVFSYHLWLYIYPTDHGFYHCHLGCKRMLPDTLKPLLIQMAFQKIVSNISEMGRQIWPKRIQARYTSI